MRRDGEQAVRTQTGAGAVMRQARPRTVNVQKFEEFMTPVRHAVFGKGPHSRPRQSHSATPRTTGASPCSPPLRIYE